MKPRPNSRTEMVATQREPNLSTAHPAQGAVTMLLHSMTRMPDWTSAAVQPKAWIRGSTKTPTV